LIFLFAFSKGFQDPGIVEWLSGGVFHFMRTLLCWGERAFRCSTCA
jgi:hypothetical protein